MAFQGMGMGLVGLYGFFIGPMGAHFGASTATMTMGMVLMLVVGALMSPVLGAVLDRVAVRPVLLFGILLASLSFWMMSRAGSMGELTFWFIGFLVGMVCYGPLSCNVLLIRAYGVQRVRALAIAAIGVSLASISLPPLVAWMLERYGWQSAMTALAALILFMLAPLVMFVVEEPARGEQPKIGQLNDQLEPGLEFLRQPVFWLIGVGMAMILNAMILISVVLVPHFLQLGFSVADAATVISMGGVGGLLGKLCFAAASASVRPYVKHLALALVLGQVAGWSALAGAEGLTGAMLGMMLVGTSGGIIIPFYPYINSVYFDERIIGKVNGAQAPLFLPLGLASAPLAGMVYERTGSYVPALQAVVVMLLVVAVIFMALPRPAVEPAAIDRGDL